MLVEGMFTQQACVPGPVALAVQRYGSGGLLATAVFELSVAYVTETVRTGVQERGERVGAALGRGWGAAQDGHHDFHTAPELFGFSSEPVQVSHLASSAAFDRERQIRQSRKLRHLGDFYVRHLRSYVRTSHSHFSIYQFQTRRQIITHTDGAAFGIVTNTPSNNHTH